MERIMKLLVFVGLLYSVQAQSGAESASLINPASSVFTTSVAPTSSVVPTSTSSSSVPRLTTTHIMKPTPTPSPPPKPTPELGNYTLSDDDGVCLKMSVSLNVNTTYNSTDGGNMTVHVPVYDTKISNHSFCTKSIASLLLEWNVNDTTNYLNFTFHKNSTSWVADKVNYTFEVTDDVFPGFPNGIGKVSFSYDDALFRQDDTNRRFNQSYLCSAPRDLNHKGVNFTSVLTVEDLQVQAFDFKNSTSGEFDSAYNCNNRGNKIVPIAVGAALAGLVVVVLIAYLIGRLKRRNQGSYEALS